MLAARRILPPRSAISDGGIVDKTVYVIGHKNPDTDSVVSAVAYAELKRPTRSCRPWLMRS
jgi:c-di-AMP phosphodiesterase-like protein